MSELKVIKIELNNHGKPIASIQGTTSYYGISPNDTFYPQDKADEAIAELKAQVNGFKNMANLWHYNAQNEHNAAVAVRMENAKLKNKADKADKVIEEKDAEIAQLQAMLEERNKQVGELKGDIADLRDDKKLTDAILDERNAEIAELKAENKNLKDTLGGTNIAYKQCYDEYKQCDKELRHNKYKRCLAMADKCVDLCHKSKDLYRWADDENLEHHYNHKIEFFARWHNRWLVLAEKFKEAK